MIHLPAHILQGIIFYTDKNIILLCHAGNLCHRLGMHRDFPFVFAVKHQAVPKNRLFSGSSCRQSKMGTHPAQHPGQKTAYATGAHNSDLLPGQICFICLIFSLFQLLSPSFFPVFTAPAVL